MSIMLLLAAATASPFALPHAGMPLALYVQEHAPASVDSEHRWAVFDAELFVDPRGKILDCSVESTAGDADLARQLCSSAIGQRIAAATDFNGSRAFGVARSRFSVSSGSARDLLDKFPAFKPPRLVVSVKSLPAGWEPSVTIGLIVNTSGHVAACDGIEGKTSASTLACSEASRQAFDIRKGAEGKPVTYLRTLATDFVVEK